MSRKRGSRPRRGPAGPNVLVEGDTGIAAGPQGGAGPAASESGDLASREFGVPAADIPGGLKHLVNPETHVTPTVEVIPRPADYHKEHGVEPPDWEGYQVPADESLPDLHHKPAPEPVWKDAVPVYQVDGPGKSDRIVILVTEGPLTIPAGGVPGGDPLRIAVRDPHRRKFWIVNETTAGGAGQAVPGPRIGDWETTADGRGMLVAAASTQDFNGQDDIYLINTSGSAVTVSFGYETSVEVSGI